MTLLQSKTKYRVLLLEGIHSCAQQTLKTAGFDVELLPHALQGDELVKAAKGFHAIGIRSKTQLTGEVLSKMTDLQCVGAFCIGTNQIDLESTNRLGFPVYNAPYSNTRSVAELIISEMIALSRRLGDINNSAHKGKWDKSAKGSNEVRGKTVGIVGYGHIGTQVSILAEAMGFNVIYYDIIKKLPLGNARPVESLSSLLKNSDFVTLHVPETDLTKNMMGKSEFQQMRKGSYFLNASRGTVVDIPALAEALKSEHLAGAAVDVFPEEPGSNNETFHSPLQEMSNVILTPHIGGSTEEAQEAIGYEVSESLIRFLKFGSTHGAVSFPQLDVPLLIDEDTLRITNVHKNVPGVLSQINSIISNVGANIRGQYLSTDNNIGYVVMDIRKGKVEASADQIEQLETSICTRVL